MKKWILISVLILIPFTFCACNSHNPASSAPGEDTSSPKVVFFMAGKINAQDETVISSKISARVSKVMVDIGSRVNQVDPVIYLDSKDLEAQVKQAEAAVSTAKANLSKTTSGARPEQILKAQAAVKSTKKNYENAKENLARMTDLLENGSISKQQFETAESQFASAESQYKVAQEELTMLEKGETQETINVQNAQVKQAEAALDLAQAQYANSTIVSPVSGIVSSRSIDNGEMAIAGQSLVTIVDSGALIVNAYTPSRFLNQIKTGDQVTVKVSEVNGQLFSGEKNGQNTEKWWILIVVVIGTFMSILDSSIVNIAISKLMTVFGTSLDNIKWVLTAYSITLGTIIPVTGYLSDTFGTKKVYIFALASFTIGSFLCGLAWNNTSMIIFRIAQALGGGMILPVGMSIIFQAVLPEERGMALGFWGIASMAAPALGPTLCGIYH